MSNSLTEFENSLTLWLPGNESDTSLLPRLHECHLALDALLEGKITFQYYCDVLSSNGVDMDDYLDIALLNTTMSGF